MNKVSKIKAGISSMAVLASSSIASSVYASGDTSPQGRAQSGLNSINDNAETDIMVLIKRILLAIFTIVGIIAVVMIILGGVNYATSQGDPQKVKKGKDTILYGIIGLVVVILAFAIVNFVLGALS